MPRYLVERSFDDGLHIPINADGAATCLAVVGGNADHGVTWVHSYVNEDKSKTYCIYDGPSPESIRKAAEQNGLPVDHITKVTVLDPYFYS
jgi:hypothetical protein